jgi:two-component SAPR family response regulator
MKIILVDDDKAMLIIMKRMISKIPGIEIVGSFQSPREAFVFLMKNRVDMAFVDINMPEECGLDLAKRILMEGKDIAITFITAHKEYALEAFEMHAFDYIVKPISQSKLENTILLAKQRLVFLQPNKEHINAPKLFIKCLGGFDIRNEYNELVHFTSSKSIELLAYLLMKKGRYVSKWSIIEAVFKGMSPFNAETYLNTTIYKLRKAFEPYGMRHSIISSDESYRIELDDIYVDFIDFENRISLLISINNNNQEEVLITEKIFCGELFGEKDYYWSLSEKERLLDIYISYAKKMIIYLLENNVLTEAQLIAKKLVNIDEFDEDAHCLLMKIYAAQRNRILLDKQFYLYSNILGRELGITPGCLVINLYKDLIKLF